MRFNLNLSYLKHTLTALCMLFAALSQAEDLGLIELERPYFKQYKPAPQIAIVIDDLGYHREAAERIASLPYPITLAVIPGTPHAHEVSALVQQFEKEMILHIPMQALQHGILEHGLDVDMPYSQFRETLQAMLQQHPRIIGVNNHGGSLLTQNSERMQWLMEVLSEHQLFFLDSRTTEKSVAVDAAIEYGLAHAERDVFLDNVQNEEAIAAQFNTLRKIARKYGKAIAIGHPHKSTIAQLEKELPALIAEGFELHFCSELLQHNQTNWNKQTASLETNSKTL